MWAPLPKSSARSSPLVLAALVALVAAVGPVGLSWLAAGPVRSSTAHAELRGGQAGAGSGGLRRGAPWLSTGLCLALWGGGLLHARGGARAARRVRRRAAASEALCDVSAQPGVCAPWGKPDVSYWDPAGLAEDIDSSTFRWYRTAELKHGRVSMMAIIGFVTQHYYRFEVPGYDLSSAPSGIGAATEGTQSSSVLGVLVLLVGVIELSASDDGRDPGDFGDPFDFAGFVGLDVKDADQKRQWKNFELNHGRLAMWGVIGTLLADYGTGLDGVDQWARAGAANRRFWELFNQEQVPVPDLSAWY